MQRLSTSWLFLILLQLVAPMSVRGSAPAPALSWVRESGAESCITSIELAKQVEALLGRLIFVSASEAELVVEGYVRPNDTVGFTAKLVVSDSSGKTLGSRDLATDQPDCKTLNEALVLVIAVTLNPKSGLAASSMLPPESSSLLDALFAAEPTEPDPKLLDLKISSADSSGPTRAEQKKPVTDRKQSTPVKQDKPVSPSENSDTEYLSALPEQRSTVAFGASGVTGTGLLPDLNFGVAALFRLMLPEIWPIEISGTFWLPNQGSLNQSGSKSRTIELVHAGPSICPLNWHWKRFSSVGCVGAQFGVIRAKTVGLYDNSGSTTKPVINFDLSASFEVEVFGHFFPRLAVRAALPTLQHNFRYFDQIGVSRELFFMSQIGLITELGLALKF